MYRVRRSVFPQSRPVTIESLKRVSIAIKPLIVNAIIVIERTIAPLPGVGMESPCVVAVPIQSQGIVLGACGLVYPFDIESCLVMFPASVPVYTFLVETT